MRPLLRTALAAASVLVLIGGARAADDVYAPPNPAQLKAKSLEWAASQKMSAATKSQVEKIWADADANLSPRAGFDKVIATFTAANAEAKAFIAGCKLVDAPLKAPSAEFLAKKGQSPFFANNMRLYFGRYLAQRKMYDDSLTVLNNVDVKTAADPATALYFKGVCEHQLLMKKEGLATLAKLLRSTEQVPVRYSNTATLMEFDLKELKEKSLKKISLKMRDSERRLDLANGGQRVQKLQGDIIADLDEMIEKLEQQGGS